MANFDAVSVANQARTGVVPPEWRLFPLVRRSALLNLISGLLVGLILLGAAVYLFATDTAYVPKGLPDSFFSPDGIRTTSIIESLIFAALGVWLLLLGLRWIRALQESQSYFLVVTPDGFAEVRGEKVVGLAFAQVAGLTQKNGYFGAAVQVRKRAGGSLTLEIGKTYGPPREIVGALEAGMLAVRSAQH